MSKIAVVTDSIASLPPEIIKKYNIIVAPCYLIWDKVQYRDGVDMTALEAFARLKKSTSLPTTTSAIQGEFIKIFQELKGKVDAAVVIPVSGGMGACGSSALSAKEMFPELKVEIVDSRAAYMGEGFPVIAAAKVAAAGGDLQSVVKAAQAVVDKCHTLFYVDGTEYLKKCGRVSLPQEVLDKWQKTKAMLIFKNGKLDPQQIKGNPIDQLIEYIDQTIGGNKAGLHLGVVQGDLDSAEFEKLLKSRYNPVEMLTCIQTPVAGVHTGPGVMGVSFYQD
jgi:DegV family protein with EDD domain